MTTNQLIEALTDISKENNVFHYTNVFSLIGILKSGKIKAQEYPSNTTSNKKPEIAVVRKGAVSDKKVFSNLSASIGNIAITLYTDRIKASVRGASIKPIAELPFETKRRMSKMVSSDVIKYIENNISKFSTEAKTIEVLKEKFNLTFDEKKLYVLYRAIVELKDHFAMRREGEERIHGDIPVNKELMKIRILPGFKNDWALFLPQTFLYGGKAKDAYYFVKNNEDLFLQDATYTRFLATLEKLSKMSIKQSCDYLKLSKDDEEEVYFKFNIK